MGCGNGDNKHVTVFILTVLCVGVYIYLYVDINSSLQKLEDLERSTYYHLNLILADHNRPREDKPKLLKPHYVKHTRNGSETQFFLHNYNISGPILTIFTSWSKSNETDLIRNNTVRNWSLFSPYLYPILFTNDTGLKRDVRAMGWDSLPIIHSGKGVPVLKHMYLDAMKKIESPLYAFVNGDILFTQSLLEILVSVLHSDLYQNGTVLVVGRRTNVLNVKRKTASSFQDLANVSVKIGSLFTPWGLDYFITSKTFPWRDMPDVVIGRVGYDNFLVVESNKRKIAVIDATKTLLAVHQTTKKGGNFESRKKLNKDYNINLIAKIYKKINYGMGTSNAAKYFTKYNSKSQVYIVKK
nr:uncharacterized protein LOC117692484 isoform X2 [Crassostrea gigas]XP_034336236.1 uncharacterized protein LOC117692484 isoform X2 [Crassostrea gigas]